MKKSDTAEQLSERMRVFGWNSKLASRIRAALARAERKGAKKERERCEKIARSFGGETYIGRHIADEIRSGK